MSTNPLRRGCSPAQTFPFSTSAAGLHGPPPRTLDQNANAADAAKRGAFWDLTEYLQDSEAYPNLSQISPDVLKGLTVDGQIIGIPRSRAIGRNGLGYRTDWAEAVGITEAPKTVEDVYDMLYKFTYDDPDGNGANDTYGLEMCKYTGPWDIIQTWFGCGNGWVEQDGKLVPVHQTAEYKEALDWMRKIYADGLVRPDWATVDTANFQVDSQKGVTGVFVDTMDGTKRIWKYFEDNAIADVNDADLQQRGFKESAPSTATPLPPPATTASTSSPSLVPRPRRMSRPACTSLTRCATPK